MFDGVISSKTKARILIKLFLNPGTRSYLRELAAEFNISPNAVRSELNILKNNKILISHKDGRNILYEANQKHPLFPELSSMVRKITGIEQLVSSVVERLGDVNAIYLVGDYAKGSDTGIIDIVVVGSVERDQLEDVIRKTENYINRKVRQLVLLKDEFEKLVDKGQFYPRLALWNK